MARTLSVPEHWLPVVGWVGFYEVSDLGRVRSCERVVVHRNGFRQIVRSRILKPGKAGKGYSFVVLCRNGKKQNAYVHRLVLEAFVGPCPEGMEALHGPAGRGNNTSANLRWGTPQENDADQERDGVRRRGELHGMAKLTEADVLVIRAKLGKETQRAIGEQFGVCQGMISRIARGIAWSHVVG